jgi:hypothetical protein
MTDHWRVTAAAVAGGHHMRTATGCQDAFAVRTDEDLLVVAMADGGSSARLAGVGAHTAAALALETAWRRLRTPGRPAPPDDGPGWAAHLQDVLAVVLETFGGFARDASRTVLGAAEPAALGTTLTLLVVRMPWVAAVAVGDGFVVIRRRDEHLDLLLPPDDAVARDPGTPLGHTVFVTSALARQRARTLVARLPDLSGVAVSTDGLSELGLVYERSVAQRPHAPFFRPIFTRVGTAGEEMLLVRLLASERVCQLTTDDKTLVVAVPA